MEEETLIWVGGLVIEGLAVAAAVLAVLLRRSRKTQQQLLAQLAGKAESADEVTPVEIPMEASERTPEAPVAAIEIGEIEQVEQVEQEKAAAEAHDIATSLLEPTIDEVQAVQSDAAAAPARATDASTAAEFDQLLEIVDSAGLDESTERLQQRLEVTNQSLQRLEVDLQEDPGAAAAHPDIETLKGNLQEITSEVGSLQESSARLQQDLRDKTLAIEQSFAERHEITERELHQAKKLRREMTALRDKLRLSESDVQKLQEEKQVLAAEYAALNQEYERIYANSTKKGA